MSKDIKQYLKYFIGCKVLVDDEDYGTLIGGEFVPNEVENIYYSIHLDKWPEGEIMPFNDDLSEDCRVKPILRKLEDMTEEEAGEVFQLERNRNPEKGGHDFDLWREKYGFRITRFDLTEQHLMLGFRGELYWVVDVPKLNIQPANNYPLIFHYLLSKGFDLFSLIDSGAAIDSKTLQPQQQ